tara:strand:- start:4 stop:546 length:543 start_codon:yes stop_codon:yes gene_type:complete
MDNLSNIFDKISTFDLLYLLLNIYFVLQCTKKGFVLSILSASKWILAYVITLYLFPKAKPYTEGILDNEYILDIVLGIILFILVIFIILIINKSVSRAVTFTGLGSLDRVFGFFFGFVKSYIIVVCIYTTIDIVYNNQKWPIDLDKAFSYMWVEKGSNYLIKGFPDQKEYEKAKEQVQDL